jgi:hypothetical protein
MATGPLSPGEWMRVEVLSDDNRTTKCYNKENGKRSLQKNKKPCPSAQPPRLGDHFLQQKPGSRRGAFIRRQASDCSSSGSSSNGSSKGSRSDSSCSSCSSGRTVMDDIVQPLPSRFMSMPVPHFHSVRTSPKPDDADEEETVSLSESSCSQQTAGLEEPQVDSTVVVSLPSPPPRRVTYDPYVQVREYAVTVGDHPCCQDGLPLTLDWYPTVASPLYYDMRQNHDHGYGTVLPRRPERRGPYQMPTRLSLAERRARLFECSALHQAAAATDATPVRSPEIEMVLNMLQQSWSQTSILPLLPEMFEEIEEVEDILPRSADEKPVNKDFVADSTSLAVIPDAAPAHVVHWQRVSRFQRQKSFCE